MYQRKVEWVDARLTTIHEASTAVPVAADEEAVPPTFSTVVAIFATHTTEGEVLTPRVSKAEFALRANLAKARSFLGQAIAVSDIGDQIRLDEAPDAIYQQNDGNHETQFRLEEETMTLYSEDSQVRARVYQGNISDFF